MNRKLMLGYVAALCLPLQTMAQIVEDEKPITVTKVPVSSAQDIEAKLFEVSPEDVNYYFRANLPGGQYLVMQFKKIGYWPVKGTLKQMFETADIVAGKMADSLQDASAARKIDIHVPIANEPLSVRLKEYAQNGRLMVIKGRMQGPLKVAMDTINIVKTFSEKEKRSAKELSQVQYSFMLKDINEIKKLSANSALIDEIENKLDDLVQRKRRNWMMDNAWFHAMNAEYNTTEAGGEAKLKKQMTQRFVKDAFHFHVNAGAGLLSTGISPYISYGLSFKWPSRIKDEAHFVRASFSTFCLMETLPSRRIEAHSAVFANIESGRFFYNKKTGIPLYEISAGIGKSVGSTDHPALNSGATRLFINYSITKTITITPDFYFLNYPSGESSSQVTGGLTLSLRLL